MTSLTFDDGTRDHLGVASFLADRGFAATFYVNSNRVGSGPGRLDWNDLDAIAALGHEIGGHGSDHLDLATLDLEAAAAQIEDDRRRLIAHGHKVVDFAYPYGSSTAAVRELVRRAGYLSGRRAWGLAPDSARKRPVVESLPPDSPYAVRTVPNFEHGTTLAQLKSIVGSARRHGGWLPLVFHRISDGGSRFELAPSIFEGFIDWLCHTRGSLEVRPVRGVIEI